MQERVKTSFIPKASLQTEKRRKPSQSPIGIINVITSIILIASIIAAIGIFLFEGFTAQNITRKRESLERARAAFEPATIKELARLDARLDSSQVLLNSHVAPSLLFDEIERQTLSSVRFRDFSLGESGPGRLMVAMSGEAASFNALALQSDIFGRSLFFSEPIFSDFNIDTSGNVIFSFSAVVNFDEIAYRGTRAPQNTTPTNTGADTSSEQNQGENTEVTP